MRAGKSRIAVEEQIVIPGAAWVPVQAGTHTLKVLDGLAEIENREAEGFVGYLQQRHKPFLDTMLTQLARPRPVPPRNGSGRSSGAEGGKTGI